MRVAPQSSHCSTRRRPTRRDGAHHASLDATEMTGNACRKASPWRRNMSATSKAPDP